MPDFNISQRDGQQRERERETDREKGKREEREREYVDTGEREKKY